MRALTLLLGCLILLLGLAGCDGKDLGTDSFVGTWAVTSSSKALLPAESQRVPGRLSFAGNGEFISEAVPGELLYSMPGMNSAAPVSGTGIWKVHKLDGNTALLLTFQTASETLIMPSGGTSRAIRLDCAARAGRARAHLCAPAAF